MVMRCSRQGQLDASVRVNVRVRVRDRVRVMEQCWGVGLLD